VTITLEQLGIYTESRSPLREFPSAVVYAASGCGKSTEFAVGFQDALFVKTSRTVTRPYYSWLRMQSPEKFVRAWCDFAIVNAAHTSNPEYLTKADEAGFAAVSHETGNRAKLQEVTITSDVHNWSALTQIGNSIVQSVKQGQSPVVGVVFDEMSDFVKRVIVEMDASGQFKTKKGKDNDWAVQDAADEWLTAYCNMFRDNGLLLGMVCQEAQPVYFDKTTKVKYKGGPETPIGRLRETICRAPDIVLRITLENGTGIGMGGVAAMALPPPAPILGAPGASPVVEQVSVATIAQQTRIVAPSKAPGPTQQQWMELFSRLPKGVKPPIVEDTPPDRWAVRKYWTEAHPEWNTKFRSFEISAREELGLRRLLERASYL